MENLNREELSILYNSLISLMGEHNPIMTEVRHAVTRRLHEIEMEEKYPEPKDMNHKDLDNLETLIDDLDEDVNLNKETIDDLREAIHVKRTMINSGGKCISACKCNYKVGAVLSSPKTQETYTLTAIGKRKCLVEVISENGGGHEFERSIHQVNKYIQIG